MKTIIFHRIQDIDPTQWNQLLSGHSCTFSHEFWLTVEQSALNDFHYRHILFLDDDSEPLALATVYSITTDIAIFAPAALRRLLNTIRQWYPRFLKFSMLECGTPVTLNSPPIVLRKDADIPVVLGELHRIMHQLAKTEGHFLMVLRDFEANAEHWRPFLKPLGYHWVPSLPNTWLNIRWRSTQDWRHAMKSYYRSKLNKHLRKNEAEGIRHERIIDFAPLAVQLCQQWLVVHEQADEFQREVLTPAFYRAFSDNMGERAQALLYYRGNELVGHALLLMDGDVLRWLYFGRKTAVNDSLYLYVGYSVVSTAIELGFKRLEMGLTTYPIKQDLGAEIAPIYLALRGTSAFINLFVGLFYPLLNSIPGTSTRHIFKSENISANISANTSSSTSGNASANTAINPTGITAHQPPDAKSS